MNTCKKGLNLVSEEMLQCVRERCLDKKVCVCQLLYGTQSIVNISQWVFDL